METKRKIGTVGYIASTKGLKFKEEPKEWYNPVEAIKDKITEDLKGHEIEITLIDDKGTFSDFQQLTKDGPTVTEETIDIDGEECYNTPIPEDAPISLNELSEEIPKEIIYSTPKIDNVEKHDDFDIYSKLSLIQTELKVGKDKHNKFGNFDYRSTSDILEALKPLLKKYNVSILITDRVCAIGNRYYIEATATLNDGFNAISTSALARESDEKKGMDSAQVTGSTSSYARKYALNGLFAIDDAKDIDGGDNGN